MGSTEDKLTVGVVGTGYVGLTTGACLASMGHDVTCADIDSDKVARLNNGEIPILEEGLEDIVKNATAAGNLRFVTGAANAADADVVLMCVPTPQGEDGSADLSYLRAAGTEIRDHLRPGAVVVNKSTVPVGSANIMESVLQREDVYVASNPEFLREGTAVSDFLNPDRVVIGATDPAAADLVKRLYANFDAPIVVTDPASAEIIKYAANGFLAMKLSFINEVATLCELVDAEISDVIEGIGLDTRISPTFLNPGPGWGGSCFPKDTRAIVQAASEMGHDFALMREVIDSNDRHQQRMVNKIAAAVERGPEDSLTGVTVCVWGLTFKAHTDDLRESPSLVVISELLGKGATVQAYDPTVSTNPEEQPPHPLLKNPSLHIAGSALEATENADVLAVLTEWPEFADVDLNELPQRSNVAEIIDTRNLLDAKLAHSAGIRYQGVGHR